MTAPPGDPVVWGAVPDATGSGRPPRAWPTLPRRLAAPAPGWTTRSDVVVVGSGIAGLTTALLAREYGRVVLVTKDALPEGATRWAQGGIAAAIGPGDTPEQHLEDTMVAGAGLCDEQAVRVLVEDGPAALQELIALGTRFDVLRSGELALGREGGHLRHRIVHAGGDATGAEISRALVAAVMAAPEIEVVEHALALDLLIDESGASAGITLHVMGEGEPSGVGAVRSRAVVLASGGLGQVYSSTTNPAVATGDGMALALRAGAALRDLEFVQFHPTVLWLGGARTGQQPLISEAVRGEGAVLVDHRGERFMTTVHELADLAPRDVVAKAIMRRMRETGAPHVWLDGRALGADVWEHRFPTIAAVCRSHGIDPVTDLVPVAPACHYASGGVATDLDGRTTVPGLYACGEVACSGVHGANRLASNSLLEGLVFARRIAADLDRLLAEPSPSSASLGEAPIGDSLVAAESVPHVQAVMTESAGVLRTSEGLAGAAAELAAVVSKAGGEPGTPDWQATNLVTVSTALIAGALLRAETRGSHWRDDHMEPDDAWLGHLDAGLASGHLVSTWNPLPSPVGSAGD